MGTDTKFSRPTLTALIERISNDLSQSLAGVTGAVVRRSTLGIIARVFGGAAHLQHGHLDWISTQVIIDKAEAEWLERYAAIWKITRKAAAFAAGTVEFTGTDAVVIPAGTVLVRNDGAEFTTDADATISGGTASGVAVTAAAADTDDLSGNTAVAVSLSMQQPQAGLNSTVTVDGEIAGGSPTESDDDLRARLLFRIQNPPRSGHENDYVAWALEVSGVTRAWAYSHYTGTGKVGVTFVLDDTSPIIPNAAKLTEVEEYIETKRPATVKELVVFAPAELTIAMTINIEPSNATVQAAIQAEIEDFFSRWTAPGDDVKLSQLNEAISIAAGETDHEIVSTTPAATGTDIVLAANELPKLGTITWGTM